MVSIEGSFNMYMVAALVDQGDEVLDIMTGKGDALINIYPKAKEIVAVDIYAPYIKKLSETYPDVTTVIKDSLEYLKTLNDSTFDVVLCIDGIEHITKEEGLELIKEMKRVARKRCVVFTPEGFSLNTPHDAWGISGGDEHQLHKSGWLLSELEGLGFSLVNRTKWDNAYTGEPYHSLLVQHEKV